MDPGSLTEHTPKQAGYVNCSKFGGVVKFKGLTRPVGYKTEVKD